MSSPAASFRFLLTERVQHPQSPGEVYCIVRRYLDVDAPPDRQRLYLLRSERALLNYQEVGPVQEAELSLVP